MRIGGGIEVSFSMRIGGGIEVSVSVWIGFVMFGRL